MTVNKGLDTSPVRKDWESCERLMCQWHKHYLGWTFLANCKETAALLQPLKPTLYQMCLTGIGIVMGTWDKKKVVLLSDHPRPGEKNVSTADTGRETGVLMAQTEDKHTWHVRLLLVLDEVRKEANLGRRVLSLRPYSSDSVVINPLSGSNGTFTLGSLEISIPADEPGWGITDSPVLT